jgi:hypothetical protein
MRLSFLPPPEPVSLRSRQRPTGVARDSKHCEYTRNKAEYRRNCTALQGPWHGGDQEEAKTVAEKMGNATQVMLAKKRTFVTI